MSTDRDQAPHPDPPAGGSVQTDPLADVPEPERARILTAAADDADRVLGGPRDAEWDACRRNAIATGVAAYRAKTEPAVSIGDSVCKHLNLRGFCTQCIRSELRRIGEDDVPEPAPTAPRAFEARALADTRADAAKRVAAQVDRLGVWQAAGYRGENVTAPATPYVRAHKALEEAHSAIAQLTPDNEMLTGDIAEMAKSNARTMRLLSGAIVASPPAPHASVDAALKAHLTTLDDVAPRLPGVVRAGLRASFGALRDAIARAQAAERASTQEALDLAREAINSPAREAYVDALKAENERLLAERAAERAARPPLVATTDPVTAPLDTLRAIAALCDSLAPFSIVSLLVPDLALVDAATWLDGAERGIQPAHEPSTAIETARASIGNTRVTVQHSRPVTDEERARFEAEKARPRVR